jgi:pyruvate formate lyase activating enzyme
MHGLVFNIQRFSIHDGPGIRTTVFFKGCPLHCFWCHNPEGLQARAEVQFSAERCLGCRACAAVCAHGGHEFPDGVHLVRRENCQRCGQCVAACCSEALELAGRSMTIEEIVTEVLRDRVFYDDSGGGVTLSGGEPLWQPEFARELLRRCRLEDVRTAVETCGHCRWEELAAILPLTDLVLMDLKHLDADRHRTAVGVSNRLILANARKLMETDKRVIFRVPVIPTVNDTPEALGAIAAFVHELAAARQAAATGGPPPDLELLGFHRLASAKYRSLGMDDRAAALSPPSQDEMAGLARVAASHGIAVRCR